MRNINVTELTSQADISPSNWSLPLNASRMSVTRLTFPARHTSVSKSRAVSVLWVFTQAFFNRIIEDSIFNVYVLSFPKQSVVHHFSLRRREDRDKTPFENSVMPSNIFVETSNEAVDQEVTSGKSGTHYSGKHLAHVFHFSHIPVRYL